MDIKNPHSLSLFEKKIKGFCKEVKDKTLSKYFLENFIEKINELTPNLNRKKNKFSNFKKIENPLKQTKEIYNKKNMFTEKELKEFSLLYIVIFNLDIFRKNVELISELTFSNSDTSKLKQKLVDYLLSEKFFDRKEIEEGDFDKNISDVINKIKINAPIKIILNKKKEEDIILIFNEIVEEIKKINLRKKIESLEDKVSMNLDEKLYSELLSLRNQLKSG